MRTRPVVIAQCTLAAVLVLGGCSSAPGAVATTGPSPVVTIPADPAAALAAASSRLGTQSARFTISYGEGEPFGSKQSGVVDPATGRWELTSDSYVIRRIDGDVYVKLTKVPATLPEKVYTKAIGKWIHQRVPHGAEYSRTFNKDFPWYTGRSVASGTDIVKAGDRSYRGRISFDESIRPSADTPQAADFVVELDGEGRITRMSLVAPDAKVSPTDLTYTYTDFGLPVDVSAPPPGEVIEMLLPLPAMGIV
ncbi:hypothetical protein GCM10010112_62530 [Actinoplanes lobatus]|nr:hypothetical protein [Actinoplanes lobatus]MBB4752203.1 hypothetical protein [Actinoplanes lobatus]GGN83829.1 hypothetical protein GCM10010112_62530 [Actinoplanes lobatus]